MAVQVGSAVTSPCPACGTVARRTAYDVGSGPELSCASCEWCWGANGQPLRPVTLGDVWEHRNQGTLPATLPPWREDDR